MKNLDELISYVLLSIIGLGIIMFGIIASNFGAEIFSFISFLIGIAICVYAFFAARKLID